MLILSVRTDKPEAEIGLYENNQKIDYISWQAHRELAETIHQQIREILNKSSKSMEDLQGIAIYKGPGSFTGLRIGLSVANSLAYSLSVPIVSGTGESWLESCMGRLNNDEDEKVALPEYGAPVHITQQRK